MISKINLEDIARILFWIFVIIVLVMIALRIIGKSPTIEQISTAAIPIFLYLAIESRLATSRSTSQLRNAIKYSEDNALKAENNALKVLKEIRNILKKRK